MVIMGGQIHCYCGSNHTIVHWLLPTRSIFKIMIDVRTIGKLKMSHFRLRYDTYDYVMVAFTKWLHLFYLSDENLDPT